MSTVTIKKAVLEVEAGIRSYLEKDKNGKYLIPEINRMPFYLVGPPGIGKTQMIREISERMGIGFISLSVTHHTRNTVLGLPVIVNLDGENGYRRYTEYTMSEIIADVEKKVVEGYTEGILLIDEFASMSESLVAPMLAFLQTRNIGNYKLPEGWSMVLCSNPTYCSRTARTFDAAIMDRVRLIEVEADGIEFLEYGNERMLHPVILEFLRTHSNAFFRCETEKNGEQAVVTARGWENLSYCLTAYENMGYTVDVDVISQFIKCAEISTEFYSFYKMSMECGASVASDIIEARASEVYKCGLKQKEFIDRWVVTMAVYHEIAARCRSLKDGTEQMDMVAGNENEDIVNEWIYNACSFIADITKDDNLIISFIGLINKNQYLLEVLANHRNEMYLKYCRQVYG